MSRGSSELPWKPRTPEPVRLDQPERLYEDDEQLSDLLVSPSGAVSGLRRIPDFAEVVVWPGRPRGRPESWTGSPNLPLLDTFGFDGNELYGRTQSSLLRIRPGKVETLVETGGQLRGAGLSPDRTRLFWIEHARKGRLLTTSTREKEPPREIETRESCTGAVWLADGRLVVSQLHSRRGADAGASLWLCTPEDELASCLLETREWILCLLRADPDAVGFFMDGTRHDYPSEVAFWRRPVPRRISTWRMRLGDGGLTGECIANATPAGGTVEAAGGACLFADAGQQTAERSVLVAASARGVKTAEVPAFLRNFAVAGNELLYRTFGSPSAVLALPLGPLVS